MKIIVVSGDKSGVGKTYAAERLLNNFPGWVALKVTVSKERGCPSGKNCGVCAEIIKPFYIIKDSRIINQSGKDTFRLKKAGAKKVIWLKAKPSGLAQGLRKALSGISAYPGVVIEGNSVLKFIQPDVNIHINKDKKYVILGMMSFPQSLSGNPGECLDPRQKISGMTKPKRLRMAG